MALQQKWSTEGLKFQGTDIVLVIYLPRTRHATISE